MKCFGGSAEDDTTPPQSDADASLPMAKSQRKSSLTVWLESIFTPPSTPHSSPTSPSGTGNRRRSWKHKQRPIISEPLPLVHTSAEPDSRLSRSVREGYCGFAPPLPHNPVDDSGPSTRLDIMDSNARKSFLHPATASTGRLKQIKEAQEMTKRVEERAKKSGAAVPPYDFLELIGKGSFGRVFKSRRQKEQDVVAVKVIDVDSSDYKLSPADKDLAIKDFITEIKILNTLKDSKAKNINLIHDAFNFHSQLWIISEYCPGGSVATLLKASPKPGLDEKYIIAISRELAVALKYVHEAGIIHRDVKAANVLITQDGQLQLCDFGVSGILESGATKRTTVIGTPFWMAPELHLEDDLTKGYGQEIDCWAFGCTVYELATGQPPNANIAPQKLHMFLKKAPRLEGGEYSPALREFVSFSLEERPEDRPDAEGILRHPYIANTSKKYPTTMLRQLIERFAQWENEGGQRASLFHGFGAAAPTAYGPFNETEDEWNFSTTDDFEEESMGQFAPKTPEMFGEQEADEETPRQRAPKTLTAFEQAQQDQRATRGARKMARLFDENAEPYEYTTDDEDAIYMSDLPLRRDSDARSADRETIIDLDVADLSSSMPNLDLANVDTIKANRHRLRFLDEYDEEDYQRNLTKRLTRDWKFPMAGEMTAPAAERPRTKDWTFARATSETRNTSQSVDDDATGPNEISHHLGPPFRPMLKHTTTEPVGNFNDFVHSDPVSSIPMSDLSSEPPDRASMIDMEGPGFSTLSRQQSFASSAGESSATTTNGDHFYLDDTTDDDENINKNTLRPSRRAQRSSFHGHSQSEPSAGDRTSNGPSIHTRGSSLSSESEIERQYRLEPNRPNSNSAPMSRQLSVKESIDKLRVETAADEWWAYEYAPRLQEAVPRKKKPFLKGGDPWAASDTEEAPSSVTENDVSDVETPQNTWYSPESMRPGNTSHLPGHSARAHSSHDSRDSSHLGYQPGGAGDRTLTASGGNAGAVQYHGKHRREVSFPRPQGPSLGALEDDADQTMVARELERLLDDFSAGLNVTARLLDKYESEEAQMNDQANDYGSPETIQGQRLGHVRGHANISSGSNRSAGE